MTTVNWTALRHYARAVPLTRTQRLTLFRDYVSSGSNLDAHGSPKSYRAMAADLGGCVTHVTLQRWVSETYPALWKTMAAKKGPRVTVKTRRAAV